MNKTILMGRLTRDVELKRTQSDMAVANFTLAVNRRFGKGDETDFINIVAWGKTAEFCNNYFEKGRQVAVSGRIQTRNYENKEGQKVYVTEVVAEDVYFADSKKDGGNTSTKAELNPGDETDDLPF
jgi:single-strand DNA-binding protein